MSISVGGWHAVVAVNSLDACKRRLHVPPTCSKADLVMAMFQDVVAAAAACDDVQAVSVVTCDPAVQSLARTLGVGIIVDVARNLNDAFAHAASAVVGKGQRAILMPADLPCLSEAALGTVLRTDVGDGPAAVPDMAGTGTAMVLMDAAGEFQPQFGKWSFFRHVSSGAHPLREMPPQARMDVDTVSALEAARQWGLGVHTLELLQAWQQAAARPSGRTALKLAAAVH